MHHVSAGACTTVTDTQKKSPPVSPTCCNISDYGVKYNIATGLNPNELVNNFQFPFSFFSIECHCRELSHSDWNVHFEKYKLIIRMNILQLEMKRVIYRNTQNHIWTQLAVYHWGNVKQFHIPFEIHQNVFMWLLENSNKDHIESVVLK